MEFEGKNKKNHSGKAQKIIIITCISIIGAVVVGFAGYGAWSMFGNMRSPDGDGEVTTITEVTTEPPIPLLWYEDPDVIDMLTLSFDDSTGKDDLHNGDLILVNPQNNYLGDNSSVVSMWDNRGEAKYATKDRETSLRYSVIQQFNRMMLDFATATGHEDIVVISGFRTREYQQQLYANGDPQFVAKPGYSEHETGYSVDINIQKNTIVDFDGLGDYAWIPENASKYGFILRYPENKYGITGISYEPWHYRFVGIPHATYIYNNKMVLEEYIAELRTYPIEKEHLYIQAIDGKIYEVYFVPSSGLITNVPVYKNVDYTVSGNNVDGYIITVDRGVGYDIPITTTVTLPVIDNEDVIQDEE